MELALERQLHALLARFLLSTHYLETIHVLTPVEMAISLMKTNSNASSVITHAHLVTGLVLTNAKVVQQVTSWKMVIAIPIALNYLLKILQTELALIRINLHVLQIVKLVH